MADFVKHIRAMNKTIPIVAVAGVVQEEAVGSRGKLVRALGGHDKVTLVALRFSKREYKGKGKTDTGHRLFNTTHLE